MSSIRKSWHWHWSRTLLWAKALQTPCAKQQLHRPTNQVDNCIAGEDVWRLRQRLGIIFHNFLFTSHAAHLSHAYFLSFFFKFPKMKRLKVLHTVLSPFPEVDIRLNWLPNLPILLVNDWKVKCSQEGHSYSLSCLLHCKLSVSVRSFTHSNCVSLSLRSWSPAGPTTTKACWRRTAQSLNVTGLKGLSWGEKAHILLSVRQRSFSWAGVQTDMKLFYFGLPYEQ